MAASRGYTTVIATCMSLSSKQRLDLVNDVGNLTCHWSSTENNNTNNHFYRMMRVHSVDYAMARCPSVCPSICLSVCHTPVLSLNGCTYPQTFFTVGLPHSLVFPYQTGRQYSDEDPLTMASNARGYEKITIFDQYPALSRN